MVLTIADFVVVEPVGSHKYSVTLADTCCAGTVLNGGYIASAFLVAARAHMGTTHASLGLPDPFICHFEYLQRGAVGAAIFTVKDIKLGSRLTNLHVTLSQKQSRSGTEQVVVEGSHPPLMPVDLAQLRRTGQDSHYCLRRGDPITHFRDLGKHMQRYLRRSEQDAEGMERHSTIDQWVRCTPHEDKTPARWTNDAFPFLVDMFPHLYLQLLLLQAPDSSLPPSSPAQLGASGSNKKGGSANSADDADPSIDTPYWYPTLAMNLDIKKLLPRERVEWMFLRVRSKTVRNGRMDLDVELWDEIGELVATSTHVLLVVDVAIVGKAEEKAAVVRGGKL